MLRTLVVATLICVNVSGCAAMAEAARQQAAERQAQEDALRARIAELTPEQRDNSQKCAAIAVGRINALRMVNSQAALPYLWMSDSAVVRNCLNNPYYYETIPQAPTQVIVNTPPPGPMNCNSNGMGGGFTCY